MIALSMQVLLSGQPSDLFIEGITSNALSSEISIVQTFTKVFLRAICITTCHLKTLKSETVFFASVKFVFSKLVSRKLKQNLLHYTRNF